MRLVLLSASIAFLLCMALAASARDNTPATHYRWHDAHGGLHYSDSIPPDAVGLGYDIVDDNGLLVRHIEREKTPAERAAAEAEAARAAAAKRDADRLALADTQLLAAYPNEAELREAHQAKLQQMQQSITTTQSNLRSQEQNLADLLAHAAELERSGKPVPPELRTRLADQRQSVADERKQVAHLQSQREATARQLDAELQRYRMLSAQAKNSGGG
ncbi:MAG TPA: DUF4124 domain-containing protein [Rhodanobacteraceae bacterium]|nr:DUF4124 domain-containing protein [Rhodanobacteraceae bacterium]